MEPRAAISIRMGDRW